MLVVLPVRADEPIYGTPLDTPTDQVSFSPIIGGNYLYQPSTNEQDWTSTSNSTNMFGLIAYGTITLNGSNVTVDSFYPTNSVYTLPAIIRRPAPLITKLVRISPEIMALTYTNCSVTNYTYALQFSTNLIDWQTCRTFNGSTSNNTQNVTLSTNFPAAYYRIQKYPFRFDETLQTNGPF